MFTALVDFSLRNRSLVLGTFFVLSVAGVFSALKLPVDAVPDITNVQAMVIAKTGALDPEKVEQTVTYVIETELQGIPGVEEIRSISKYGLSLITIIFDNNTNIFQARQQITERLTKAKDSLPAGIAPELAPMSTGLGEVFFYAVVARENSPLAKKSEKERLIYLRTIQDYIIKPQLKKVKGIADIDTFGGYSKEIHINLNPDRLVRYGLTIEMVAERLKTLGENYGGGYIQQDEKQIIIRTLGRITNPEHIRNVPIKRSFYGGAIRLGEICDVTVHHPQPLGGASFNGEEAVIGMPMMLAGANSRNVATELNKAVGLLNLPDDVSIKTLYSRDFLVNATVRTILKNLVEGAAFVVIILLLILGNTRAAILVSLAIPLSMLIAFIGMKYFNVSGNLMSLGAIDFGLLVDASVVMFENMIRKIEDHNSQTPLQGQAKLNIIRESVVEVLRPVITAMVIIMGVFVPLFALEGVEGKMFKPMAQTVLLAMAASLVLAIVLMPVLGYLFFQLKKPKMKESKDGNQESPGAHHVPIFLKAIIRVYQPALQRCLIKPALIIIPTGVLLVSSLVLFFFLGGDFIPQLNEGDMVINLARSASSNFDHALESTKKAERIIKDFPEVQNVYSRFGTPDSATDAAGVFFGDTFVILKKDLSTWRKINGKTITKLQLYEEIAAKLQTDNSLKGQEISMTQPIEMRFNEMLEGSRADVTMRLYGTELDKIYELSKVAEKTLSTVRGVQVVQSDPLIAMAKSPVLDIELNYNAISYYGLSLHDVNNLVQMSMSGYQIGTLYETTYRFPIMTRIDPRLRNDISKIKQIPVGLDDGGSVSLGKLAKIEMRDQVSTIARSDGRRYAALSIYLKDIDVQTFVNEAKAKIEAEIKLPEFYEITWGGKFKNLDRAKKRLGIIIPLTLIAIFVLLVRYFDSYRKAALVFLGIPAAVVGGVITLSALQMNFSISAGVGFIALMGIAILNSLVLVTHYDEQCAKNSATELKTLILEATLDRLRPVIITTLVAGLGFLPMAINSGLGAEVQKPLASVVIGGLIISTILTLFLVPVLYVKIQGKK